MSEQSTETQAPDDPTEGTANPYAALVRVRVTTEAGVVETNMGRFLAESSDGVEILDEPVRTDDGRLRDDTRAGGRDAKPKTTVADQAAAKKAELEAEIARRNAERAEDDQIVVEPPGNKAELIAALKADDEKEQNQ